ncbi:hypothetical protein B4Q13_25565, partial [Lacticaseibacillus rhamnosus]
KPYKVSALSFFQTNTRMAEALLRQFQAWLPEAPTSFIDLYAGVGTFLGALPGTPDRLAGIESSPSAVEDAEHNLKTWGIKAAF